MVAPVGMPLRSNATRPRRSSPVPVLPAKKNCPAPLLKEPVPSRYSVLSRTDPRETTAAVTVGAVNKVVAPHSAIQNGFIFYLLGLPVIRSRTQEYHGPGSIPSGV